MTAPKPPLDLAAIEARASAAWPGEWRATQVNAAEWRVDSTHDPPDDEPLATACRDDAEFIAHARTDVPALVARVRELEAALRDEGEARARMVDAVAGDAAAEAVWDTWRDLAEELAATAHAGGAVSAPLDLAAIEALCAGACPGPWTYSAITRRVEASPVAGRWRDLAASMPATVGETMPGAWPDAEVAANGRFIAAAREAMPAMLARIRELEAALSAEAALADEFRAAVMLDVGGDPSGVTPAHVRSLVARYEAATLAARDFLAAAVGALPATCGSGVLLTGRALNAALAALPPEAP